MCQLYRETAWRYMPAILVGHLMQMMAIPVKDVSRTRPEQYSFDWVYQKIMKPCTPESTSWSLMRGAGNARLVISM